MSDLAAVNKRLALTPQQLRELGRKLFEIEQQNNRRVGNHAYSLEAWYALEPTHKDRYARVAKEMFDIGYWEGFADGNSVGHTNGLKMAKKSVRP